MFLVSCASDSNSVLAIPEVELQNVKFAFYCSEQNFRSGDKVEVKVNSTENSNYALVSIAQGDTMLTIKANPFTQQSKNTNFYKGCDWITSFEFTLPDTLSNGIYGLFGVDDKGQTCSFPMVISERNKSELLIVCSTHTWQAYNFWGGGSFYRLDTVWKQYGTVSNYVHFDRPNPYARNSSHLIKGELHLHKWLNKQQIGYELCSDLELSTGVDLSKYKTIVLNCHNEYWTDEMYDSIERFTQNGGNLISLGGNQMYARVTYKDGQMEFHEHGGEHQHDGSEGGLWRNLNRPESGILGVQYTMDLYDTYAPYQIIEGNHWVFGEDVDLTGQQFGSFSDNRGWAAGHEMDVTTEFSPTSTTVLAKGLNGLELSDGIWTSKPGGVEIVIGEYPNGGQFFSVGSITFSGALAHDPVASDMLLNVLTKFKVLIPNE